MDTAMAVVVVAEDDAPFPAIYYQVRVKFLSSSNQKPLISYQNSHNLLSISHQYSINVLSMSYQFPIKTPSPSYHFPIKNPIGTGATTTVQGLPQRVQGPPQRYRGYHKVLSMSYEFHINVLSMSYDAGAPRGRSAKTPRVTLRGDAPLGAACCSF